MALIAGFKLGPYEILSPLGAGGMGEVYRARDTRLDRTVAIKVLPAHLSSDPGRRQRFEREARAVSSLNHPHICVLYDIGTQDDIDFLVLEYLEGETLAHRLERGPMPTQEMLRIATETSDALDKAHRQGVIHRDLKPGNIMLVKSGAKLLDFGLAKPVATPASGALTAMVTESKPLTVEGTILGTFQYIAPEQLEGKEADARSDIFSFGAVLYEMATGKKAFQGKTTASVIAAVLAFEPTSISTLQPMTPPALERVVKKCLMKDADERWQSAKDLHDELKWIVEGGLQAGAPAPVVTRRNNRELVGWALAATLAVVTIVLAWAHFRPGPTRHVLVSSILTPPGAIFNLPRISSEGRKLVVAAAGADGRNVLWVRPMDSDSWRALSGTEGAGDPFWSADGRSIGFFADAKLKTIPATGGAALPLCDAPSDFGATWSREGTILFVPNFGAGVYRISASGGAPSLVATPDKSKHINYAGPHFLPDDRHFIYSAVGDETNTGTYFASLDGRENKLVVRARGNAIFSSGFLFYPLPNGPIASLMAQTFDSATGQVQGQPQTVVQSVAYVAGASIAVFDVSESGLLIYGASSTGEAAVQHLLWLSRSGKTLSAVASGPDYFDVALSADGQRLAYAKGSPSSDIWVEDSGRGVHTRLTFDPSTDKGMPVWSPDAKELLFDVRPGGKVSPGVYRKSSNGAGGEELLAQSERPDMELWPTDWSRDQRFILCSRGDLLTQARGEIWVVPASGDRRPRVFIRAAGPAYDGHFSPDGRWVAYTSKESGREDVYVVPFDPTRVLSTPPGQSVVIAGKWEVSPNGGALPRWRRDGKELFYIAHANEFVGVGFEAHADTPSIGETRLLFRKRTFPSGATYDVSFDGQRFIVNSLPEEVSASLTLVANWPELLTNK